MVFDRIGGDDYEQVVFCHDRPTGLRAIIAIHSTRLGPALGGTRFYPFASEDEALTDVLRLARGMTYKAAVAGLDLGGGKAVIMGDPLLDKTEAVLRAYGRHVQALSGRYLTAEDVGTTQADMDVIRRETRYVTGTSPPLGGSGDPSTATAYGVLWAMKAVAQRLWGSPSLHGRHVAVAGVGKVGSNLVRHLVEERAQVSVADVTPAAVDVAVERFAVTPVAADKIHTLECDIYSPCALGGTLNPITIPELRCASIVGAANNQLADAASAVALAEAGVLYVPDYVVNAGGLIAIAEELAPRGWQHDRAIAAVRRIFDTTAMVLADADAKGIPPVQAADRMAEQRLELIGGLSRIRIPNGPGRRRR